jgi:NhaA family Na+:H+ antiporter
LNLDLNTYDAIAHPLQFWVNDVGMVFFFALAAKEVFEATLPDLGLFNPREDDRRDTLNRFEHWWCTPVQFLLFGFANAGVPFEQVGPGTYYVLAGLLVGKPIGVLLFSSGAGVAGADLPPGVGMRHLLVVGVVASIGLTMSLCFATATRH